ncbi:kynureninase [Pseudonocardia dioxanivorans]|jgi:kynureninase|uniref:Kynureninase n=1 Tax=Pseudonocardia dioxanivorans (strain ATCC 55486 / DSM 44775 / JCM 13855 / CB1190) TaxID=675635 RepID=F4CQ20_PSEUX|nr:kynureninase [Pseudonocardia dioxanivorans]AEA27216.1 kynureninase [Pseudonocardia dioxanivorans CB1190]
MTPTLADAERLDAADPLASFRDRFLVPDDPGLVAYLDGNSLGRPPKATAERLAALVTHDWGTRLIRSWSEGWMELPFEIGDRLAAAVLGAEPGQTVVADSTTVCLYKLMRAAAAMRPGRDEVVADRGNFPTDRYVVEAVAAECGLTVRWISPDPAGGVTLADVVDHVGERTAFVTLSHVAYRSAWIADLHGITAAAHDAGALVVWDLCHSVGSVPLDLDAAGVDLAAGCTYKFLNAGPGAPAFLYVAAALQDGFAQPITGWMGHAEPFAMGRDYAPATGMRRALSGTPPITGLIGVDEGVKLVAEAGMDRIRAKAVALTELAVTLADDLLDGVGIGSPRDPARRGGHVTVTHPDAKTLSDRLIAAGVVVDHRPPDGIRIGLSPLTTSFAELHRAMTVFADVLQMS